ncbi:MAG: hypothetical protein JO219_12560 [Candidatus Eremiobacteraeota bacterium]|nr:hypothetical protein [Candidatus Eremiobacteraeota bacterium]MBV8366309.1 hypothetical protein [Candidatus Eremiobacteraeota bacterium]
MFLIAPAGYGKTTFAREIPREREHWATVDCSSISSELDLIRRTVGALIDEQPDRAARLSAYRLARDESLRSSMFEILDAWGETVRESVFIFDNVEDLEGNDRASALLLRLLSARPRGRQIVVCSRVNLRARISRFAPPNDVLTLRTDDLAFDRDEFEAMFADADPVRGDLQAAYGLARGWPIASLLLARFARDGRLEDLLVHLHDVAFDDLYDYLASEVLGSLNSPSRRALDAAVRIPNATADDIRLALGDDRSDVDLLLSDLPFVAKRAGGAYEVHPFMRAMIERDAALQSTQTEMFERVARGHEARGRLVRAAQMQALRKDTMESARLLEAAREAAGPKRSEGIAAFDPDFAQLLETLDMDAFIRYPHLWYIATHAAGSVRGSDATLREAEILLRAAIERDYPVTVRGMITLRMAIALNLVGRPTAALALVREFLSQAAGVDAKMNAELIHAQAYPLILLGRLDEAMRCLEQARALISPDDHITAWGLVNETAWIRMLRGERADERVLRRIATETARQLRIPTFLATALGQELTGAWLAGEDELVKTLAIELDAFVAEHSVRVFRHFAACANGRIHSSPSDSDGPSNTCWAYLFAAGHAGTDSDRIRFLEAADEAATAGGRAFGSVMTNVALALTDPARRARALARAREHARTIESEPLHVAVAAICAGARDAGMLNAFVRRFVPDDSRITGSPRSFSILTGTMRNGDTESALAGREYDLMLALTRGPRGVARDRLIATVWPDEDGERGRKTLNSTMRRLRARVGEDAIAYDEDVYRLAGDVAVDTWAIEATWKRLRSRARLEPSQRRQLLEIVERLRAYRESGPRAPEWFDSQARQLGELAEEIAAKLARDHLAADEPAEAAAVARSIIAFDDLDETAWEILIRAMLAQGDRAGAARELHRYRKRLRVELGVELSAALSSLVT